MAEYSVWRRGSGSKEVRCRSSHLGPSTGWSRSGHGAADLWGCHMGWGPLRRILSLPGLWEHPNCVAVGHAVKTDCLGDFI